MELNKWVGPIKSPYGHHIVLISNYKDGYFPEISMVLKPLLLQDTLQGNLTERVLAQIHKINKNMKINRKHTHIYEMYTKNMWNVPIVYP